MRLKINRGSFYTGASLLLCLTLTPVAAQSPIAAKTGIYGTSIQRGFSAQDDNYAAYDYDLIIKDKQKNESSRGCAQSTTGTSPFRCLLVDTR